MNKSERSLYIEKKLEELFPETPIPLKHKDPYTLLVAVLLSARCTDAMVNRVTPILFKKADTPGKMARVPLEEIKKIVKPCGSFNRKAEAIAKLSRILVTDFNGKVPSSFEELEKLPGVGHKTASVVMSQAFNVPAFPVDTHIHRLAQQWELTKGKNVVQTEEDLKKCFPKESWNKLHLRMIFFGRTYCQARQCDGKQCLVCQHCFSRKKQRTYIKS